MKTHSEIEVLRNLLPSLQAEGYEVYLHPPQRFLPAFLKGYKPDAIALRADKNLVIEVGRRSDGDAKNRDDISALFKGQTKWEHRLVWLQPSQSQRELEIQAPEVTERGIAHVRELLKMGRSEGALLLAWATFEALARALFPDKFQYPQTPEMLIEYLAHEGCVTPSEADLLRVLAEKRNRLSHGVLQINVETAELEELIKILIILQAELVSTSESARH